MFIIIIHNLRIYYCLQFCSDILNFDHVNCPEYFKWADYNMLPELKL